MIMKRIGKTKLPVMVAKIATARHALKAGANYENRSPPKP